jgi:hypothetical protein
MALSHPQFGLGAGAHQEVLFCAAIMRATLVVLARRSVPKRMRSIADSAWWRRADGSHPVWRR